MEPGINKSIDISTESVSTELVEAYQNFELDRSIQGRLGLEWRFRPLEGQVAPFCVARVDGRIVGLSSNIPARVKLQDQEGIAYQAVDSFVSEEVRGQGLFTKLATVFSDQIDQYSVADIIWGFPNKNAAPAWFGNLGWQNFGQVPLIVRPLRAGYFLRKMGLWGDFRLIGQSKKIGQKISEFDSRTDRIWSRFSVDLKCAIVRDSAAMNHRFFASPEAEKYYVAISSDETERAVVVSCIEEKHGGQIAYILEAMGGRDLEGLLESELSRLAECGAEVALAWCFRWSPNFDMYRAAGFWILPEPLRPVQIFFGAKACSTKGSVASCIKNWYLSYFDSDGI